MASVLKRKRGQLEVVEPSKKSKSNPSISKSTLETDLSKVGWEAAFGPGMRQNGRNNAINGGNAPGSREVKSPESEYYEDLVERGRTAKAERKRSKRTNASTWKTSEPIGGRMIEVDPVFTDDEKFLIITHRKAIHVYSTSNSLLHRTINLSMEGPRKSLAHIIDHVQSPTDSNIIWVACSNGSLFKVNWASGEGGERSWKTPSEEMVHMTVASMDSAGERRDIIFTTEKHDNGWRISAHELSFLGSSTATHSRVVYTSTHMIQILKAVDEGTIIVAASGERVLLGTLRSTDFGTIDKIRYEFRIFESTDFVSSLDARVSKRSSATKFAKVKVVDVVVGDVKGAIFVHNDLLRNLIGSQRPTTDDQHPIDLIPRKLHWHRKAVHCVKWSLDGSYIISGGSETVLVLWQLDTGRQQYLPHLSATIQNIVVSPRGTSYAVHLGDNSTMILSTSELVPTANIAGIQAHVIGSPTLDSRVWRLEDGGNGRPFIPRTPAVINPAHPKNLLLAVGEVQEIQASSASALSTPFLQTFDIASNHNISRQAITRTNVTNKNITPGDYSISEPVITHIQISHDGMWLATVDEWLPPKHDVEFLGHGGMNIEDEQCRRREVYLKFWQWNKADESWVLVSRIDAPHTIAFEKYGAGRVVALSADPSSNTFSTLGEDGMVQIWRSRIRKRDGIIVQGEDGQPLCTWSCHRRVSLGTAASDDDGALYQAEMPSHGSLAFSEDGSLVAAAVIGDQGGIVHLVNPVNGTIQSSRSLMYHGDLISMTFVAQYLIILAEELRVYDLVLDKLKYGMALGDVQNLLFLEQKAEMIHLAVDRASNTFAIALPCSKDWNLQEIRRFDDSLSRAYSEIAVFDPRHPTPIYTQQLPSLVTALLPAVSSPGYVILDAAAEITTISPKATQTLTSTARPMVDLHLDTKSEGEAEPVLDLMQVVGNGQAANLEVEEEPASILASDLNNSADEDDDGTPVVNLHQLSQILDIGPSFALPPIEELFYAVASLLSSKPKPIATKDGL